MKFIFNLVFRKHLKFMYHSCARCKDWSKVEHGKLTSQSELKSVYFVGYVLRYLLNASPLQLSVGVVPSLD